METKHEVCIISHRRRSVVEAKTVEKLNEGFSYKDFCSDNNGYEVILIKYPEQPQQKLQG